MTKLEQIRQAARKSVAAMTGVQPSDGDLLISSGRIDSLSVLKLISRLEQELGVRIPPATLQPEDFDSVDLIVETVDRVAQWK
jgi:acyl carrier protein